MGKLEEIKLDNTMYYKGFWGLSDVGITGEEWIDSAVSGILKINDGKLKLELNGLLYSSNISKVYDGIDIFGCLSNGLYVKLEKCYLVYKDIATIGYRTENYMANKGYILHNYQNNLKIGDTLKATQAYFSLDYLDDWYNIELPFESEFSDFGNFSIKYTNDFFDKNNFEIFNGDFSVKLVRNMSAQYILYKGTIPKVESCILVSSKNNKAIPIYTLYEISMWIKEFINFITQTFGKFIYFDFTYNKNVEDINSDLNNDGNSIEDYTWYRGRLIFPQLSLDENKLMMESLRLSYISKCFGDLINKWFINKNKLDYIMSLYTENQIIYLDIRTKLVNQIRILEIYYENFIRHKGSNTSSVHNKKYLVDKLKVVLDYCPDKLKSIFYDIDSNWYKDSQFIYNFSEKLKNTRNFYIHGSTKEKKIIFKDSREIIRVSQVLDYIIYFLVFKTLEVDENIILSYPYIRCKLMN